MINTVKIILLLILLSISTNYANDNSNEFPMNRNLNFAIEYAAPKDEDRQIQSVFLYALYGREFINRLNYSLYGGVISTFAWGNIMQFDENFREVKYNTKAGGIGPAVMIRVDFLRSRSIYFSGDFLFGVILYSAHFPPGGDIYNFFRKYGFSFGVAPADNYEIALGLRDMHVSNGQGMVPKNPSYEGIGISIEFTTHL